MADFYTEERLRGLTYLLLTRFLPMSNEELQDWEADPEAIVLGVGEKNYETKRREAIRRALMN